MKDCMVSLRIFKSTFNRRVKINDNLASFLVLLSLTIVFRHLGKTTENSYLSFHPIQLPVTYVSLKKPRSSLTRWVKKRMQRWSKMPRLPATSSTKWKRRPTSLPPRASASDTSFSTMFCRYSGMLIHLQCDFHWQENVNYLLTHFSLKGKSVISIICHWLPLGVESNMPAYGFKMYLLFVRCFYIFFQLMK